MKRNELSACRLKPTDTFKCNLHLLHIIHNTQGKNKLCSEILNWAHTWQKDGCNFPKCNPSRKTMIKQMRSRAGTLSHPPEEIEVTLPASGVQTKITRLSFPAAAHSLLSDVDLMDDESFAFPNPEDPFAAPIPTSERTASFALREICDSENFHDAHQHCVEGISSGEPNLHHPDNNNNCDGRKPLAAFLLIGIDKSNLDFSGKLQIEPIKFSFSFFKQSLRDRPSSWGVLGHMPCMSILPKDASPQDKITDWHFCLSIILEPLVEAQRAGGLCCDFLCRNEVHKTVLKVPIHCILGDSLGQQTVCGHHTSSSANLQCCQCMVTRKDLGNPHHKPKLTDHAHVQRCRRNNNDSKLCDLGFCCMPNFTFDKVQLCDLQRGLLGIVPGEILHVDKHGNYTYLFTEFFGAKRALKKARKRKTPARQNNKRSIASVTRKKSKRSNKRSRSNHCNPSDSDEDDGDEDDEDDDDDDDDDDDEEEDDDDDDDDDEVEIVDPPRRGGGGAFLQNGDV